MFRAMRGMMSPATAKDLNDKAVKEQREAEIAAAQVANLKRDQEKLDAEKEKKRVAGLTPQQRRDELIARLKEIEKGQNQLAAEREKQLKSGKPLTQTDARKARDAEIAAAVAADAIKKQLDIVEKEIQKKNEIEEFENKEVKVINGITFHMMYEDRYNLSPRWYFMGRNGEKRTVYSLPEPRKSWYGAGDDAVPGYRVLEHQSTEDDEAAPTVKFARTKAYFGNLGSALKGVGQALFRPSLVLTE